MNFGARFPLLRFKVTTIDRWFFCLITLDLLFFPYIRFLSASLSMLLVPLWFLWRGRAVSCNQEFALVIAMLALILMSFFVSFIRYPAGFVLINGELGSWQDILPNSVVMAYMLLYYVFFKTVLTKAKMRVESYLLAYLFFVFCLCIIFYFSPEMYFKVRAFWTMYDNVIHVSDFNNAMFRFTGTLSEPNSFAAIVVAVTSFLIMRDSVFSLRAFVLLVVGLLIVFSTMSNSGFVLYILLVLGFFILPRQSFKINLSSIAGKIIIILLIAVLLFCCFAGY